MVLGGFVGGFGWFWMVLGGFGSFWVVPCFSNYGFRQRNAKVDVEYSVRAFTRNLFCCPVIS